LSTPGEGDDASRDDSASDRLDALFEEYAGRRRRGERVSIEEYVAKHPTLAAELGRLLPAAAFLERYKPPSESGHALGMSGKSGQEGIGPIEQLGDTRIVRELGRGGMGIVYEGEQEILGRRVAVKVLPRQALANKTSRERFHREAKLVARLQHPNIVPIHTIGEEDGIPYFVMALIDGSGLDRILEDGVTIPPEIQPRAQWVAGIGCQAAEALAYAHGQNVLHRDIKPSNFLLDSAGTLWLADFGLSKLADDLSLTRTGELPGTLRYLAPECLKHTADARSDIYSLGLTLYELLVGRPAFADQDRIHLLHRIDSHDVPAPSTLLPGLDRDLETIVLKAMEREPSSRYPTAELMAADLRRFLSGEPILARRPAFSTRIRHWARREPVAAALAATSVVLGVLLVYFVGLFIYAPPPMPRLFEDPAFGDPSAPRRFPRPDRDFGAGPPPEREGDPFPFPRDRDFPRPVPEDRIKAKRIPMH
jgi:serine/threonine protein kinase